MTTRLDTTPAEPFELRKIAVHAFGPSLLFGLGKGAILLTAHLGPWEVGAIIVRSLGMPISIVYVPDRFAEAEHFRSLLRRGAAGDVEEIPLDLDDHLSTLPALRALAAGRLLAMQGDREPRCR